MVAENDIVVTPLGERARVLEVVGTSARVRYLNALPGAQAEFEIAVRLLSKVRPGLPEPRPVRLAWEAA